jgi:hypothetical protein
MLRSNINDIFVFVAVVDADSFVAEGGQRAAPRPALSAGRGAREVPRKAGAVKWLTVATAFHKSP